MVPRSGTDAEPTREPDRLREERATDASDAAALHFVCQKSKPESKGPRFCLSYSIVVEYKAAGTRTGPAPEPA